MTPPYTWVDDQEMFTLVLARPSSPSELAAALAGDTLLALPTVEDWPTGDAVKFVTGQSGDWTYTIAFAVGLGLRTAATLDRRLLSHDVALVWFDINANSEFRSYQDGSLVRSDGVELIARVTGTDPDEIGFTDPSSSA